jgi:hypothetical protein
MEQGKSQAKLSAYVASTLHVRKEGTDPLCAVPVHTNPPICMHSSVRAAIAPKPLKAGKERDGESTPPPPPPRLYLCVVI